MVTNTEILETAKSFLGKLKYVFGGNNISGGYGDCSDYTEYVFAVHGINIGADTEAQYMKGIAVDRDNIKAGDLVFFKNTYDSNKKDGVSHVGIATSNDTFIHLSGSGCIRSSLNDSYWKKHYIDAKRITSISYEDISDTEIDSETSLTRSAEVKESSLVWWGDIVRVVIIIIVLVGGVSLLGVGVAKNVFKGGIINE